MYSQLLAKSFAVVLVLICNAAISTQGRAETTAIEALLKWSSGADALRSYDVEVEITTDAYNKKSHEMVSWSQHRLRQRYQLWHWRVDQLRTRRNYVNKETETWELTPGETEAFAYHRNGTIRFLSSKRSFGQIHELLGFPIPKLLGDQLFEVQKHDFHGETFYEMLNCRADAASIEEDAETVTLRLPSVHCKDIHTLREADFEVTLDKKKGWQPRSIRRGVGLFTNPDVYQHVENTLEEVKTGIWCPTEVAISLYAPSIRGTDQEPVSIEKYCLDLDSSQFNIDIPSEVFELAFPDGTTVYDERVNENFIQNEDNPEDYVAFVEQASRLANTPSHVKRKPSRNFIPNWLMIVNVVFVLGLLSLIGVRRWRISR